MSALFIPPDYFRELRREELFPDATRPLEVELGCGDGSFFLGMAQQHPERDFFAMERIRIDSPDVGGPTAPAQRFSDRTPN